jgi:penicillin-binding protein 2
MFERRAKVFLGILIGLTVMLIVRALQVQVFSRAHWRDLADRALQKDDLIPTTRGRIRDIRGFEIAVDQPCVDACVEYPAVKKDPQLDWVSKKAMDHATSARAEEWKRAGAERRRQILAEEQKWVIERVHAMWEMLAKVSHMQPGDIEEIRLNIEQKVEMRRRAVWYDRYAVAMKQHEGKEKPSWYRQWLLGEDADAPQLDEFYTEVGEQRAPHVILRAIDADLQNYLAKHLDEFPGLKLLPSTHRVYPYGDAACHVIGHLSRVTKEDIADDPEINEELRRYQLNDLKGRAGLEALAEPMLRGTRGKETTRGDGSVVTSIAPRAGQDVVTSIDIELQSEIQELFHHTLVRTTAADGTMLAEERIDMHGAAVVIDVPTGEVRALVSNPGYDLNQFDQLYAAMVRDETNKPLLQRATQSQLEPGSTVKPMVGLGAITQGLLGLNEGIECTGYLIIGNRRFSRAGRCWTASKYGSIYPAAVPHHQVPSQEPHRGHDGNPDGFLTYSDALQRSCNVFFETVADRLKAQGLSYWFDQFGLGRPTGIGIPEATGRLPDGYRGPNRDFSTWSAGIGQGEVGATPIQMANVAATLGREGVWLRPRLVHDANVRLAPWKPRKFAGPEDEKTWNQIPERVDLHLSPEGLAAARRGMIAVTSTVGGTGTQITTELEKVYHIAREQLPIAGKTGSAEASKWVHRVLDPETGDWLKDVDGKYILKAEEPSTWDHPNPDAPWYRGFGKEDGQRLKHAWFIGYAPADKPQIAFAVMVEYGGSGGTIAGPIAAGVLEKLVRHGYLRLEKPLAPAAANAPN